MDIQIVAIHPNLSEAAIKRGLERIITDIARTNNVPLFNYVVVLEKFQEDLDFDRYDRGGDIWFNTGVITIPHEACGKDLFGKLLKEIITVSDRFGVQRQIFVDKCTPTTLLPAKIKQLLREGYLAPEKAESEAMKLSGNIAVVSNIEIGFLNELGQFSTEASWRPVAPFNFVSCYSDYMPKKFQIGISYTPGKATNLWTGEYMDIPVNSISSMLVPTGGPDQFTELMFVLKCPPKFLARKIVTQQRGPQIAWASEPILGQVPPTASQYVEYQRISCPIGASAEVIQLSRVVRLVIKPLNNLKYDQLVKLGDLKFTCLPRVRSATTNRGPAAQESIVKLETAMLSAPQFLSMQIARLWRNGFFLPADILEWLQTAAGDGKTVLDVLATNDPLDLNEKFRIMCRSAQLLTARAFSQVASVTQPAPPKTVDELFLDACLVFLTKQASALVAKEEYPRKAPKNKVYLMSLSFFPSHWEISGLVLAETNRILRMYPENTSNFIQLCFCDNDGGRLRVEPGCKIDNLVGSLVGTILGGVGGVKFGKKTYEFLGFSNSSLKANSQVWMMRGIENIKGEIVITANAVRAAIGDWSQSTALVQTPSKWAARMAQAFTKTIPAAVVPIDLCTVIEDISVKNPDYDFTDGIGFISKALMDRINRALREEDKDHKDSCAFQIRTMGAKGVVCLASDKTCGKFELVLRKSMVKFERPVSDLRKDVIVEVGIFAKVMKVPKYNRQLVQFLADLEGVPDTEALLSKVIEGHFKAFYDTMIPSTTNEMLRLVNVCGRSSSGQNYGLQSTISMLLTIKLPATALANTFLGVAIQRLQNIQIKAAIFEARVPIPGSFKVLGVCDEYRVLQEGQVYVRANGRTISGKILIYRSPVIHPGDVRPVVALTDEQVKAIKVPSDPQNSHWTLTSLDNVVVFSVQGSRPLPTMLAGGDLDGDLYDILSAESDLVLDKLTPYPPPSYIAQPVMVLGRPSTVDDIASFIGRFIIEECMGLVTNTHLVISDQATTGTRDRTSLIYSEACSTAVDFQKSGNNADLNRLPRPSSTAKPDFLRSIQSINYPDHRGEYYESSKLLGRLFRAAPKEAIVQEEPALLDHTILIRTIKQLIGASIDTPGRPSNFGYLPKVLEYFKTVYRPRLDLIYTEAQMCSVPLDEVGLFLLHAESESTSSDHARIADRMVSLVASFDQFVVGLIAFIEELTKVPVNQCALLYDMWNYLAPLDIKQVYWYTDLGDKGKRFGMSVAFLALTRMLEMYRTKQNYYKRTGV